MAHGKPGHDRDAEVGGAIAQHLLGREPPGRFTAAIPRLAIGVVASREAAQADAGQLLQGAAEAPVGEQAIEAVRRFAHVLQDQDRPLQRGQVAGAEQVGGHGEVAGQQGAGGATAAPADPLQIGEGMAKQEVAQPLAAPLGLRGQAGDQGAMDGAAQAPGPLGPEQGRDIGKAQQPARGERQRLLQQPGRPPATADAGQQGGLVGPGCWSSSRPSFGPSVVPGSGQS